MIKFYLGLMIGLKEIAAHKFRSFLTMLGIILGVASLLSMFALVAGMAAGMRENLEQMGGIEQISIINKEPSEDMVEMAGLSPGRTYDDVLAIQQAASLVAHVSPESRLGGATLTVGKESTRKTVVGTTPDYIHFNSHVIERGRFLTPLDQERAHRAVVIGSVIVDDLWPDREPDFDPIGETVLINQRPFTVVGVFIFYEREEDRRRRELGLTDAEAERRERRGGGDRGRRDRFWGKNQAVVIPLSTMFYEYKSANIRDNVDQGPNYQLDELVIRISSPSRMEEAIQQVTNVLNYTHRGVDDFGFDTREDWSERIETSVRNMRLSGSFIAGISLLVGGIGIMNIMLASITERVREIGIRRAVGATGRDIFVQIIVESTVIAFIGGLLGLAASFGMVELLAVLSPTENAPIVETESIIISLAFAIGVGILAGLYPAFKASKLDPIQALRYE